MVTMSVAIQPVLQPEKGQQIQLTLQDTFKLTGQKTPPQHLTPSLAVKYPRDKPRDKHK